MEPRQTATDEDYPAKYREAWQCLHDTGIANNYKAGMAA